jgi:hypothetical protein
MSARKQGVYVVLAVQPRRGEQLPVVLLLRGGEQRGDRVNERLDRLASMLFHVARPRSASQCGGTFSQRATSNTLNCRVSSKLCLVRVDHPGFANPLPPAPEHADLAAVLDATVVPLPTLPHLVASLLVRVAVVLQDPARLHVVLKEPPADRSAAIAWPIDSSA